VAGVTDVLEGDTSAASTVEAFLTRAMAATGRDTNKTTATLVPWICETLTLEHSLKACRRDFAEFIRQVKAQGITPLTLTADHVKLYTRDLLESSLSPPGRPRSGSAGAAATRLRSPSS
jgi:hypothetical protein